MMSARAGWAVVAESPAAVANATAAAAIRDGRFLRADALNDHGTCIDSPCLFDDCGGVSHRGCVPFRATPVPPRRAAPKRLPGEFGADLCGVGMVQAVEDAQCLFPGFAGGVRIAERVVG